MLHKLNDVLKFVLLLGVFVVLSACGSKEKKKDLPYLKSESVPALKIPADLKEPEKSVMYSVPDLPKDHPGKAVDPEELAKPPNLIESETPQAQQ